MKQRLDWVDYARGVGIILVVFAHNLGGQRASGIPLPGPLAGLVSYAYSFHMPLFFFLSGLFVMHSYRKGFAPFLQSKVRTILYPFVIWSLILGIIQRVLGAYVNHPLSSVRDLLFCWIRPIEQMWFLQALFIMFVFFALTQCVGLKPLPFFLFSAGLTLFARPFVHDETFNRGLFHLIFFGAGIWMHGIVNTCLLSAKRGTLLAVSLVTLCVQLFLLFGYLYLPPLLRESEILYRLIMAFAGILSIAALSEVFSRSQRVQWLRVVGEYSMPIFLMHTIFGSGTRIILLRVLYIYDPYLHAGLELVSGVSIPMLIAYVLGISNAVWVFEWPVVSRQVKVVY